MAKAVISYEQFMERVAVADKAFVTELHSALLQHGCTLAIEEKASGYVASYRDEKGALLNFVFRKTGMQLRLYADHLTHYFELVDALPAELQAKMAKAPDCKRLVGAPDSCNASCKKGYTFLVNSQQQQKCRYNAFLLPVTEKSMPHLRALVLRELAARN